jgi:hypothetical protein
MAFKGRIMKLQIMKDVPVVCLWCLRCACDACSGACGFSGLTFFYFPISLTAYQHLKAPQPSKMCLNGLQRSYNGTTYHAGCACGVPVVCLWCK